MPLSMDMEDITRVEIVLDSPNEDRLWEADNSGVRRIYVGGAVFLARNRFGSLIASQVLRDGSVMFPHPPARFQEAVEEDTSEDTEEDPSEDATVESRLQEEEAVESPPPEVKPEVRAQRVPGRPKCFRVGPRKSVIMLERAKKRAREAEADIPKQDQD